MPLATEASVDSLLVFSFFFYLGGGRCHLSTTNQSLLVTWSWNKEAGDRNISQEDHWEYKVIYKNSDSILFPLFISAKFSYCSYWGFKNCFLWNKLLTYWNSSECYKLNLVLLSWMSCLLYLWLHYLDKILLVAC